MPYTSKAQQAYFNVNRKELERQGVDVDEWNKASKGKKMPEKAKKCAFMVGLRETLKEAGFAEPSQQDRLVAILAQLQHHLDDAEVYSGQGMQLPAHLSLDDAEEGVERLADTVLPPGKAKVIEEVHEQGDEEEEAAGIEEPGHAAEEAAEKEGSALPDDVSPEAAFELGLRRGLQKLGFAARQLEAMVEVGVQHGLGNIKTAGDVVEILTPFAVVDTHEKIAAEEAHPLNKALRESLAKHYPQN